jgi:hypothetical protein
MPFVSSDSRTSPEPTNGYIEVDANSLNCHQPPKEQRNVVVICWQRYITILGTSSLPRLPSLRMKPCGSCMHRRARYLSPHQPCARMLNRFVDVSMNASDRLVRNVTCTLDRFYIWRNGSEVCPKHGALNRLEPFWLNKSRNLTMQK